MANGDGITIDVQLNTSAAEKEAKSSSKRIADIYNNTNTKATQDAARAYRKNVGSMLEDSLKQKTSATFDQRAAKLKDIAMKSREISQSMREMENKKLPTQAYTELNEAIRKAKINIEQLKEKMANWDKTKSGTTYQTWEKNLAAQQKELKSMYGKRAYMTNIAKTAFVEGSKTDEYAEKNRQLAEYNNKLAVGIKRLQELANKEGIAFRSSNDIKAEGQEAGRATDSLGRLASQKKKTTKSNEELGLEAFRTKVKLEDERISSTHLTNSFKTLGSGIMRVLQIMASLGRRAAGFISKLRGMRSGADDTTKSMKNLLKFALKYGLGLRSIFILYKRLRSAGVEAYKGLASQFPELQAEVNDLKNSFFQLKNSLATMAQPILSYLVPAIKTLVGWLTAAMNAIANFFAILTGAKYIYKASKANKDWAKSAGGAGKAAKEANKDIAEYDNLMLIQQDNDNGGGGGGGAADDYAGAFEKVKAKSDLAQEIKDAINRGDWEGVGYALAKRLNKVQNIVDNWIQTKLRPQGTKWAKRIARILNGLTDGWDSAKFGQTVAHGLMAIMDIIATFWETYDWNKLGKKIGTAITNLFLNWEPQTVARFLARKFNALGKFLLGLTDDKEGINFTLVGQKLGETIKKTFESIKWRDLGRGISKFVRGLLTSIRTAIQESDLGNTLATAFNELLEGLDFKNMMSDLAKTANALIKALGDAIKNANWEDIGDGIATLITEINWTEVFKTIIITAEKLLTVAQKIITAIGDAITQIDWEEIGQAIADLLASIDWGQLIVTLIKVATALIKGLGTALLKIASDPEALGSLATGLLAIFGAKWIWKKITGIFKTGLTDAITQGAAGAGGGGAIGGWLRNMFTSELGSGGLGTTIAQGLIGGTVAFQGVGSIAGNANSVIATIFNNEGLAKEYQKFSKNAIGYVKDTIKECASAAEEMSDLTGQTTLSNAFAAMFSDGGNIDKALDEFTKKEEAKQEAAYNNYISMLARRYQAGKKINDADKQLLVERGIIQTKETKSMEANAYRQEMIAKHKAGVITDAELQEIKAMTDAGVIAKKRRDEAITSSNHYAKIAQQNSITHQTAEKAAENAAIHHATIAKQQAGVISDAQKTAIATSNSYATIAQQNAQKHVNSQQQMAQASTHSATIAKTNAGVYAKAQQDSINASNHYVQIAQANAKKITTTHNDMATSSQHYVDIAKTGASDVSTASTNMATNVENSVSGIPDEFDRTFTGAYGAITGAFSATDTFFKGVAQGVKTPFSTMGDFFKTTFTNAWTGVTNVFKTNSPQFQSIQDSVSTTFKGAINSMITGINNSLLSPFSTLSSAFSKMKGFSINGASPFASLPSFNVPKIPRLAQGAVLPPNSPFLAVVGDQKQGTNIETPLDTMVDAFRQALAEYGGGNNQPIVLNLNGRQVAQAVWDEENKRYKQTGYRYRTS